MHHGTLIAAQDVGCANAECLANGIAHAPHALHFPSTASRREHDTLAHHTDASIAAPTPANNARVVFLLGLLLVCWIGLLFIESTRSPSEFIGLIPHIDKAAHFGAFSILGLLVCGLSLTLNHKPHIPIFSMPLLVVTLCGAFEECLQMFVPGRVASHWDLLADMSGGIFAILLINRIRTTRRKASAEKKTKYPRV